MTERREPTISGIRAERDESQKATTQRGKAQTKHAGQSVESRPRPVSQRPVVVKKGSPLAILLAFVGIGIGGFAVWQMLEMQKTITVAEQRIFELESKLEVTGDESSASTAALQASVKEAHSEIRKLWGVSYDTNKKAIAANKVTADKAVKSANAAAAGVDKKVSQATAKIVSDIELLNDLVSSHDASINAMEQAASQVRSLTDQLNKLERLEKELQQKVEVNEQAIDAIDAFRRSVNQQLLELKSS